MEVDSAAQALDNIRQGGQHLLMVANLRIEEARKALAAGDFNGCCARLNEALAKVGPLSYASQHIGSPGVEVAIMRVRELEVGMKIKDIGEVTHHEMNHECDNPDCVLLGLDGTDPDEVNGTHEVYVLIEQAAAE